MKPANPLDQILTADDIIDNKRMFFVCYFPSRIRRLVGDGVRVRALFRKSKNVPCEDRMWVIHRVVMTEEEDNELRASLGGRTAWYAVLIASANGLPTRKYFDVARRILMARMKEGKK